MNQNTLNLHAKSFFGLFLFFSLLPQAWAQYEEPTQQGYYVSWGGDTTYALIIQRSLSVNADEIRFMSRPGAKEKVFLPHEIKSYGIVGGDRYESHIVDVNRSSNRMSQLTNESKPKVERDTLFLNVYVEGLMSLYFYHADQYNKHFFIHKTGEDTLVSLINYRYMQKRYTGASHETFLKEKKIYINQLSIYMSDCKEIREEFLQGKFKNLAWKEKEIVPLIIRYNQLMNAENLSYRPIGKFARSKPNINWGLMAGGGASFMQWSAPDLTGNGYQLFQQTTSNYMLGLSVHWQQKINRGRWGFQGDFLINPVRVSDYREDQIAPDALISQEVDLSLTFIRMGASARYNLVTQSRTKPFIQFGLMRYVPIYRNTDAITTRIISGDETSFTSLLGVPSRQTGFNLGGGFQRGLLFVKGGLDFGTIGYTPKFSEKFRPAGVYALLGFTIPKKKK